MENASKALLMAASVLIGILILSLAVYLFVSFGSTSAEIHKQNEEQQIAQFNSQFTSYQGKECTIYDVISVANLATENNRFYELNTKTGGKDRYISVQVNNAPNLSLGPHGYIEGNPNTVNYDQTIQKILEEDLSKNKKIKVDSKGVEYESLAIYKCKVDISLTTQRVHNVTFTLTT